MKKIQFWAPRALMLAAALALAACAAPAHQAPPAAALASAPLPNVETWAAWWMPRHEAKLQEGRQHRDAELVFVGDSITQGWETDGKDVWQRHYQQYHALNLGFYGDRTEHVLWRLQHGEVDGLHPKVAVLLIGTNNSSHRPDPAQDTADAIARIIGELQQRMPGIKILLLAIFPREDKPGPAVGLLNGEINAMLPKLADNRRVFFLDVNKVLLGADQHVSKALMPDLLHPNAAGYALWADAMAPTLQKMLKAPQ